MSIRSFAATLALLLALALPASAVEIFVAELTGDQEAPTPVSTSALGEATLTLNDAEDSLTIEITLMGLDLDTTMTPGTNLDDVVGLHIHRAPAGTNGGVVFGILGPNNDIAPNDLVIDAPAGTVTSIWNGTEGNATTLAAHLDALRTFGLYLNVHTPANPGGEIRGQIVPEPGTLALTALGLAGLTVASRRRS